MYRVERKCGYRNAPYIYLDWTFGTKKDALFIESRLLSEVKKFEPRPADDKDWYEIECGQLDAIVSKMTSLIETVQHSH
jgi:hypothetical protein